MLIQKHMQKIVCRDFVGKKVKELPKTKQYENDVALGMVWAWAL